MNSFANYGTALIFCVGVFEALA